MVIPDNSLNNIVKDNLKISSRRVQLLTNNSRAGFTKVKGIDVGELLNILGIIMFIALFN